MPAPIPVAKKYFQKKPAYLVEKLSKNACAFFPTGKTPSLTHLVLAPEGTIVVLINLKFLKNERNKKEVSSLQC